MPNGAAAKKRPGGCALLDLLEARERKVGASKSPLADLSHAKADVAKALEELAAAGARGSDLPQEKNALRATVDAVFTKLGTLADLERKSSGSLQSAVDFAAQLETRLLKVLESVQRRSAGRTVLKALLEARRLFTPDEEGESSLFDSVLPLFLKLEDAEVSLELCLWLRREYLLKFIDLQVSFAQSLLRLLTDESLRSLDLARAYIPLSVVVRPAEGVSSEKFFLPRDGSSEAHGGASASYADLFLMLWKRFLAAATPGTISRELYVALLDELPSSVLAGFDDVSVDFADFFVQALYSEKYASDAELNALALVGLFNLSTQGSLGDLERLHGACAKQGNFFTLLLRAMTVDLFDTVPGESRAKLLKVVDACIAMPTLALPQRVLFIKRFVEVAQLVETPHAVWLLGTAFRMLQQCGALGDLLVRANLSSEAVAEYSSRGDVSALLRTLEQQRRQFAGDVDAASAAAGSLPATELLRQLHLFELPLLERSWHPAAAAAARALRSSDVGAYLEKHQGTSPAATPNVRGYEAASTAALLADAAKRLHRVAVGKQIGPVFAGEHYARAAFPAAAVTAL